MAAMSESQLSFDVVASHIARMTSAATASASTANSLVYILRHFETTAAATLSSSTGQRVMREKIPQIATQYPFLLHSIIAYSASHLKHLGMDMGNIPLTASYHTSSALRLYSSRLRETLSSDEVDAMVAACLLLTGLFFVDDRSVNGSWMTMRGGPHGWISVMSGLSILLRSQSDWDRSQSFWLPLLAETTAAQTHDIMDLQYLPQELIDLCPPSSELYRDTLQILGSGMKSFGDKFHFARLISFPSRLGSAFIHLISEQDIGALVILAYWFALMQSIPHWWCWGRVRRECLVLCCRLQTCHDSRVRAALHFPLSISEGLGSETS